MRDSHDFDPERFKDLVLYIADRSRDDPAFGATKLNKLLYFCDFQAYGALGHSITGATYQRLANGPAPRQGLPMLRELERNGRAWIEERQYLGYTQRRLMVKPESVNHEGLSWQERELVEQIVERMLFFNASEVSQLSHLDVGWQVAEDREEIPYSMVFVSNAKPSPSEIAYARDLVAAFAE